MHNSDKSSKFIVPKYNIYKSFIAMFTESKVIEIFCLADDFCNFFDSLLNRYAINSEAFSKKRNYHRNSKMSKSYLSPKGTYSFSSVMQRYAGRIIRRPSKLSSSLRCAHQPTILDIANSGVNISLGMPIHS